MNQAISSKCCVMTKPLDSTNPARFFVWESLESGRVLVRDRSVSEDAARALAPELEDAFRRHDQLAVSCAKRVKGECVSAHGVFVFHPKGFVRNGRGAPKDGERFDCEVDAVDCGVAIVEGEVFDAVRGEDLLDPAVGFGALGLLAITLEARARKLGRVVACAAAVLEESASCEADFEREGFRSAIAASHCAAHLEFNAEACDLEAVAARRALSSLRWNAAIWGAPVGFEKYDDRGAYHWKLYDTHDAYHRRADTLMSFLMANLSASVDAALPMIDIGAGDALFAGLAARHGHRVIAIEPEPHAIAVALAALAAAELSERVSVIEGRAEQIPLENASCKAALLLDVIEHLRNPMRALKEIRRVLAPGGALIVATPSWKFASRADPIYHLDEYREEELARQLSAAGFSVHTTARIRGVYDDVVILAHA